jgi:hypothetical protein
LSFNLYHNTFFNLCNQQGDLPNPKNFNKASSCEIKALIYFKWGQAPFTGPIYSLAQKQRVFEPYSLSLSSMVATAISQNLCFTNQL